MVVRVARAPVNQIIAFPGPAEFRTIGFSQHNSTCGAQALDDLGILAWYKLTPPERSARADDPLGFNGVFERHGNTVKRTLNFTSNKLGVSRARFSKRPFCR